MPKRIDTYLCFCVLFAVAVCSGCGITSGGSNPLVTTYKVNAPAGSSVSVEFGKDTNYGRQTAAQAAPAGGGDVNVFVAGMEPDTTYHMRARIVQKSGDTNLDADRTFTTGSLTKENFPTFTTSGDTSAGRGIELINLTNTSGKPAGANVQLLATDLKGNVIWYYDHPATEGWVFGFKQLESGNFLLVLSDYESQSNLREIDLAGNTVRDLALPALNQSLQSAGFDITVKFLHHDVLQLSNGHIILLGAEDKELSNLAGQPANTTVEGDVIVDLDPNLKPVWVWSAFDHLDLNRHLMDFPPDWTHGNALVYTADHDLLVSLRHQSWVLKIDYEDGAGSGNVVWRLGNQGDFTLTNGNVSDWQYAQHFPHIISENGSVMKLAVWDNGNGRIGTNGAACSDNCNSRAVIYDLDQQSMTATVVWSDTPNLFAPWGGSIVQLGNQNVEFDLPAATKLEGSRVMEVTQTSNPQTIWTMDMSVATAYRAYRLPSLYPGVQW